MRVSQRYRIWNCVIGEFCSTLYLEYGKRRKKMVAMTFILRVVTYYHYYKRYEIKVIIVNNNYCQLYMHWLLIFILILIITHWIVSIKVERIVSLKKRNGSRSFLIFVSSIRSICFNWNACVYSGKNYRVIWVNFFIYTRINTTPAFSVF